MNIAFKRIRHRAFAPLFWVVLLVPGQAGAADTLSAAATTNFPSGNGGAAALNVRDFGAVPNDGMNDAPGIQAAINQAGASGAAVYLPAGIYDLNHGLRAKSNLVMRGAGSASALRAKGNFEAVVIAQVSHVVLEALTLDGGQTAQSFGASLISIINSSRITVRRTSLLNSRWTGVFVTNSSGVSIVDNQIDRPALHGIEANNGVADLVVERNHITSAGTNAGDITHGKGIAVTCPHGLCRNVGIVGNTVKNSHQIAIELWAGLGGAGITGGVISGNVIERLNPGGEQFGISIDSSRHIAVTGNTIRGTVFALEAAAARQVAFIDNTVESPVNGILLSAGASEIVIAHNLIKAPRSKGIEIYSGAAPDGKIYPAKNLTVIGNEILNPKDRGIFLNTLGANVDFLVRGNTVTGGERSGLFIHDADGGVVADNYIAGNNRSGNPSQEANYYYNVTAGRLRKILRFNNYQSGQTDEDDRGGVMSRTPPAERGRIRLSGEMKLGAAGNSRWSFGADAPARPCVAGSFHSRTGGKIGLPALYVCRKGAWMVKRRVMPHNRMSAAIWQRAPAVSLQNARPFQL